MMVRFSDDNKLNSDVGGGARWWGWNDHWSHPSNRIWFNSKSPEWGPSAGFTGDVSINDTSVYEEGIDEVDITDWHVYTILWEPDGVEFLVDGEVVGTTEESPSVPMFPIVNLANIIGSGDPLEKMDLEHDTSAEVDYIKCFVPVERFEAWSREISPLISEADSLIEDLEEAGFNCEVLEGSLDPIKRNWMEGNYNYAAVKSPLEEFVAPLNDFLDLLADREPVVESMFVQAEECIEILEVEGEPRDVNIAKADLSRAEKAWWTDMDYDTTCSTLDRISAKCTEPVIVSVLGLISLPFLCRRRR
jgi:hypothetical protein